MTKRVSPAKDEEGFMLDKSGEMGETDPFSKRSGEKKYILEARILFIPEFEDVRMREARSFPNSCIHPV